MRGQEEGKSGRVEGWKGEMVEKWKGETRCEDRVAYLEHRLQSVGCTGFIRCYGCNDSLVLDTSIPTEVGRTNRLKSVFQHEATAQISPAKGSHFVNLTAKGSHLRSSHCRRLSLPITCRIIASRNKSPVSTAANGWKPRYLSH